MRILMEASGYVKRYKCPYCGKHYDRKQLIRHIDTMHENEIPEGYSATRVVFNLINKKDHGSCVICGKITEWDDNVARYNRFCSKECEKKYVKQMKARMTRVYGVDNLIYSVDQQEKMLSHRKISGIYKFSDGSEHSYVGTYEKRCLEFLDKVMEYKGADVITPGPVVNYTYAGQKHKWITDIYIAPYNLCIDCKDGGANKNNRPMKEYREKQIEKEKAIAKQGRYNYLRLTDNNFAQLLDALMEMKLQLRDSSPRKVIKINENMLPAIGAFMPAQQWNDASAVYVMPYTYNDVFAGVAIADDADYTNVWCTNPIGEVCRYDKSVLEDKKFSVYKYDCNKKEVIMRLIEASLDKSGNSYSLSEFLSVVFGHDLITLDEWKCYENITPVMDKYTYLAYQNSITRSTINGRTGVRQLTETYNTESPVKLMADEFGYYIENAYTGLRSASREDTNFDDIEIAIIKGGLL